MIEFYFEHDSDQRIMRFFDQATPRIIALLEPAMMRLMADLKTYIQTNKLQGQVLKSHKNGAGLAGSLNIRVERDGNVAIAGYVGTAQVYARIHEYGFTGREFVPNFYRMQTQAFGKPMSPREVYVRNHYRDMNMPERSYMRSSLAEKREVIMQRIYQAIREAIATA